MTDEAIEAKIQAKGLTAARITPARIDEVCSKPAQFHVFPGTCSPSAASSWRTGSP